MQSCCQTVECPGVLRKLLIIEARDANLHNRGQSDMYPSSQPKRLLLVAVGTCAILTVSNASPLADRIATYTVPLTDREFGVSSFHVAPLDDMMRRDLPLSPPGTEQSSLSVPTRPTSATWDELAAASAMSSASTSNSPVPSTACPLAVTLLSDRNAWQISVYPAVMLTMVSCTLVTLVGFVVYFTLFRWRFQRRNYPGARVRVLNQKPSQQSLRISVAPDRVSNVHSPMTISETHRSSCPPTPNSCSSPCSLLSLHNEGVEKKPSSQSPKAESLSLPPVAFTKAHLSPF
ncbi:hypothetical protein C8Q74DRAFT_1283169 [Fomes fomentarius]|nr:hypothetical protein C8Q74DRAFT_1283169 [Fomes fomentarius]